MWGSTHNPTMPSTDNAEPLSQYEHDLAVRSYVREGHNPEAVARAEADIEAEAMAKIQSEISEYSSLVTGDAYSAKGDKKGPFPTDIFRAKEILDEMNGLTDDAAKIRLIASEMSDRRRETQHIQAEVMKVMISLRNGVRQLGSAKRGELVGWASKFVTKLNDAINVAPQPTEEEVGEIEESIIHAEA